MAQGDSGRHEGPAIVSSPTDRVNNGWDDAARAIYSLRQMTAPIWLSLQPDDRSPYLIDFQRNVFHAEAGLADFPTHPVCVTVQTIAPTSAEESNAFRGESLAHLLWEIGRSSFKGSLAPWLAPTVPYRLTKWPDFTGVPHTMFQLRLTAYMANHAITVERLIESFQTEAESVHVAVNAFSLLGILEEVETRSPAQEQVSQQMDNAPATRGLWSRLRDLWGL